jgi:hypothetical protein
MDWSYGSGRGDNGDLVAGIDDLVIVGSEFGGKMAVPIVRLGKSKSMRISVLRAVVGGENLGLSD